VETGSGSGKVLIEPGSRYLCIAPPAIWGRSHPGLRYEDQGPVDRGSPMRQRGVIAVPSANPKL